jgi:exodeoxyribonuclease VII small subunit
MKQKASRTASADPAVESPSFEEMMGRLEKLVAQLEQGNLSLEESIRAFEEGIGLVKKCTAVLGQAEKRIQRLSQEGAGSMEAEEALDQEEPRGREDDELPF